MQRKFSLLDDRLMIQIIPRSAIDVAFLSSRTRTTVLARIKRTEGSLGQRASNPGVPTPGDYATFNFSPPRTGTVAMLA